MTDPVENTEERKVHIVSNGKREESRLEQNLKHEADVIKKSAQNALQKRKEARASRSPREIQARRRKAGFIIGTVLAVLVLTMIFFSILFAMYINRTMKNKVEVNLNAYDLTQATEMYAKEKGSDEWKMYQTLYDGENRILLTADQIPENLRKATVAIEDKRFYKHKGVDWKGTLRAVMSTVTGGGVQGGSTITQQLIKNITGNDETTVKRKVTEIYRALQLEKQYDKDQILNTYLNTCAVRTNLLYGTYNSYKFMTEKLGFTTLTETDSAQVGNMALGGFENGVSTLEMAAAYSAFVNDGIYTTPRTYSRVEDSQGNVIIDNNTESHVAMKKTTAYLMRSILQDVVTRGTGGGAYFSGMSIGGKTGTTDDARDRYFAGFSPYYCAAIWSGYKSNEVVYSGTNPCSAMFCRVMSRIHEGLEDPGFHSCDGLVNVTVCADSGQLATEACAADFRGSRVKTVQVAADTAPTKSCEMHKMVSYCKDGKHIATASCPSSSVMQVAALDYARETVHDVTVPDDAYRVQVLSSGPCPVHGGTEIVDTPQQPKNESSLDDTEKPRSWLNP